MSLPEQHLDTLYVPGSIDDSRPRVPTSRVLSAMTLPLFFVVAFVLAYVSALHAPIPHDLGLTIAGPDAVTRQTATALSGRAPGAFDIDRTTDAAAARRAVQDRSAVAAVVIGSTGTGSAARPTVTAVVASAGGRVAETAVTQVAGQIAQQLRTTARTVDVAPLPTADSNGSGLFYLVIISSIGGYLTMTVLYQAMPRARRRTKLMTAVVAAVLTPLIAVAAMSLSVGVYGADFGQLASVVGIDMLYVLVVGLIALFFSELLGQGAILGVLVVVLALNFPSTGGSIPESMLPPFWQAVHATWFGSGALESFRSLLYFGGNGFGWPFTRVLLWLAGSGIAVAAVFVLGGRRARAERQEQAGPETVPTRRESESADALASV